MRCLICNIVFEFDLLSNGPFYQSLLKYEVNKNPEYTIKCVYNRDIEAPSKPAFTSSFYDLYNVENGIVQIQKSGKKIIGRINYFEDNALIEISESISLNEYLLTQYAFFNYVMRKKPAIMMHSSSICYDGMGFILAAKSQTGKSTHARLWIENSDAVYVNDDKNIICLEDDKLFLYGNPWSGKHHLDNNIKVELKALVYLYQSPYNIIKEMPGILKITKLLGQVIRPTILNDVSKWDMMTDRLLNLETLYFGCNMEKEAFYTLKKRMEELKCA